MNNLTRVPDSNITKRVEDNLTNRLKAGSEFPNVTLTRYNSQEKRETFSTQGELQGRTVVIFTVPGAFTPVCTNQHLPSFNAIASKIKAFEIDKIICITPDRLDPAHHWNVLKGDPSTIDIWADNEGILTDKMGLGINLSGDRGLGYALQRSAMIVTNGFVQWINVEASTAECKQSHADTVLAYLEKRNV